MVFNLMTGDNTLLQKYMRANIGSTSPEYVLLERHILFLP